MLQLNKSLNFDNKEFDVFTIGELLIDMISDNYDDDFNCSCYTKHFGGSPANITMNIKKLGGKSVIAATVGNDGLGNYLLNYLETNNIDTNYINKVNKSTSMVLVTKSKLTPVPIFYRGADFNLQYNSQIDYAIRNSKILHFSCWPISQYKSRKTIEKAIDVARKNNVIIDIIILSF